MKTLATTLLSLGLTLIILPAAFAAQPVIREDPDQIVVELDGRTPQAPPAPTVSAQQKTAPTTATAPQKMSKEELAKWKKAYQAHLQSKTQAVENRLANRQARWAKRK